MTDGPRLSLLASTGRKRFARNLREIRTWNDMSEDEVAAGCRFPAGKLRALERAAVEPSSADLIKLATVMRVSLNRLLIGIKPRDFSPRDCPTARVLNEIEEGERDAPLAHLVLIADALGVLPTALVKGTVWRGGVLSYEGEQVEE